MSNYNVYHFPSKEDAAKDPVRSRIRVTKESVEQLIQLIAHTVEFHRNVAAEVTPKEYRCANLGVSYAGSRIHHASVAESLPRAVDAARLLLKAALRESMAESPTSTPLSSRSRGENPASASSTPAINIVSSFVSSASSRQQSRHAKGGASVGGSGPLSNNDCSLSRKEPIPLSAGAALFTVKVRTGSLDGSVYNGAMPKPLEEWCFYCICGSQQIMYSPPTPLLSPASPTAGSNPITPSTTNSASHPQSTPTTGRRETVIYANDPHQLAALIEFVQDQVMNSCLIRNGEDVKAFGVLAADEAAYTAAKANPHSQGGGSFLGKFMSSVLPFGAPSKKPIYFDVVVVHG